MELYDALGRPRITAGFKSRYYARENPQSTVLEACGTATNR